jgi:hypothetical protein
MIETAIASIPEDHGDRPAPQQRRLNCTLAGRKGAEG